jgi:pseudouridine synthase
MISQGLVLVNGKTVFIPGMHVDPQSDEISVNGERISLVRKKVYIMLNKPPGYLTTTKEENGRPIVMDLVRNLRQRVFPVGRLDYDTEGLLLLTNDGDFSYKMTHPSFKVGKVYTVWVSGIPDERKLNILRRGVQTKFFRASPAQVALLKRRRGNALLRLVISEGRKRQVKHMMAAIGHKVLRLKRTQIGRLKLGDLPVGKYRFLSEVEVNSVLASVANGEAKR